MTKKPERQYKFKCGCIGPAERNGKRLKCPDHLEFATNIVFNCLDCEESVTVSLRSRSVRCTSCQDKHYATYKNSYNRARALRRGANKPTSTATFNPRVNPDHRPGCKFYEHCLKFDLKKDPSHCVNCHAYVTANAWGKSKYIKKSA